MGIGGTGGAAGIGGLGGAGGPAGSGGEGGLGGVGGTGAAGGSPGAGGGGGQPGTIGAFGAGGAGGVAGAGGDGGNGGNSDVIFSGDVAGTGGNGGNGSIGGTGGNGGDSGLDVGDVGGDGGNGGNSSVGVGGTGGIGGFGQPGGTGGDGGDGLTGGGTGGAGGPGVPVGLPGDSGTFAPPPPGTVASSGAPGAPGTPGTQPHPSASGNPVIGMGANGLDQSETPGATGAAGSAGGSPQQAGSLGTGSNGADGAKGNDGNAAVNGAPAISGMPGTPGQIAANGSDGVQGAGGVNGPCTAVAGSAGMAGLGAVAIVGIGNTTVINDGTIAGGWNFSATAQAESILFSNGANRLEIWDDSIIQGDVLTDTATNDTFALGGDENGAFDVRDLAAAATPNNGHTEYQGFDIFEKVGVSTWTLTETTPLVTPWTIYNGVLSTSQDGNLGAAAGDLTIDGGIWQVTGTAFDTTTRDIVLGDSNDRPNGIDIADPANIFEYNLAITGSGGLQKLGLGTLELNGVSSYLGQTDVLKGTLVVGDSLANNTALIGGNAYVALGATLAGHGTIGGDVSNCGTVAPGNNDIGTLTVGGDFHGSGTLAIELDENPGQGVISDHLRVNGLVDLDGTTLDLQKRYYEMVCGDKTQVIIADRDAFSGEINPLSLANFDKLMLFDNGTGWLYGVNVLKDEDLSDLAGLNSNQQAIAKALSDDVLTPANFIDDDLPLHQIFLKLIEDCKLTGQRLDQLSPESYAGLLDYGMQVTRNYTRTAMNVPGPQVVQQPAAPPASAKGGMAKGGMPPAPALRDTTVFGAFSHYDGKSSSSNNGADYDINSNGGIAGARHTINNFTFGGFVGIDDGQVSSSFVNADASGYVLGGFASYLANPQHNIIIDGGLTYGSYEFDGTRNTLFGPARFDGGDTGVFDLFASVRGDLYNKDKLRLSPMLSVHYLQADVDAITESGPITALAVDSMDEDALLAELALNAQYQAASNITLLGSIGYTHNFMDAERPVNARFVYGTSPFSVIAPGMGEDIFSVGVGAIWYLSDAWSCSANYRAEFSSDTEPSNAVGVSLSYSF
jgi:hypothetical protein